MNVFLFLFFVSSSRPQAVALYEKGIQLAQRYHYREAIDLLRQAYLSDSDLVEALLSLGDAYAALGELENARLHYEKARLQGIPDPLQEKFWTSLGEIALLQGRFAEAQTFLERARDLVPSSSRVAALLADIYAQRGRIDQAHDEYRRELNLDPHSAHAHRGLARLAATSGNPQETLFHAQNAFALDPFDSATAYLLVQALNRLHRQEEAQKILENYRSLKKYEEEVQALEKSIRQNPQNISLIFQLAERHASQGNFERAAQIYTHVALGGVEPVLAWVNVGLLRLRQNRWEDSRRAFEEALRLEPTSAPAHLGLAELAVAQSQWENALLNYRKTLELDPTLDPAYVGLIQTLHHLGRERDALETLTQWVQKNPHSSVAWEQWGLYCYSLGRSEEALMAMEKALHLDPENFDAANNLAWLYAEKKKHLDVALHLAQRVAKERPSANAFDTLAFVHRQRGEISAAIQALEKALHLEPQNPTFRQRLTELKRRLCGEGNG